MNVNYRRYSIAPKVNATLGRLPLPFRYQPDRIRIFSRVHTYLYNSLSIVYGQHAANLCSTLTVA